MRFVWVCAGYPRKQAVADCIFFLPRSQSKGAELTNNLIS